MCVSGAPSPNVASGKISDHAGDWLMSSTNRCVNRSIRASSCSLCMCRSAVDADIPRRFPGLFLEHVGGVADAVPVVQPCLAEACPCHQQPLAAAEHIAPNLVPSGGFLRDPAQQLEPEHRAVI